tara:strand:- start:282 stop:677 length:396 start_codon:yes stop_codon:yes gene_type:complete
LQKTVRDKIQKSGLRLTHQRIKIAKILFSGPPMHFTANHIYKIVKKKKLNISLATIYNTLRDFSDKKLINEIIFEPSRNWYDTCLEDHHHFFNSKTQKLIDINKNDISLKSYPKPPDGYKIRKYNIVIEIE